MKGWRSEGTAATSSKSKISLFHVLTPVSSIMEGNLSSLTKTLSLEQLSMSLNNLKSRLENTQNVFNLRIASSEFPSNWKTNKNRREKERDRNLRKKKMKFWPCQQIPNMRIKCKEIKKSNQWKLNKQEDKNPGKVSSRMKTRRRRELKRFYRDKWTKIQFEKSSRGWFCEYFRIVNQSLDPENIRDKELIDLWLFFAINFNEEGKIEFVVLEAVNVRIPLFHFGDLTV